MARINYSEFYKNINFDVNSQLKETYIVEQNDTLSRGFYVKVIQNGRVVKPTNYDKMTLYVKKPDGKDIFEDGTIVSDRFKIGLPNQALAVPGIMKAGFTLRGAGGEIISDKSFTIIVNESFSVDPVESTDEFGALQSALAQIAGFAGELQDAQLFAESIKANLGELEDLDTDVKDNVVAAINELNGKIDNVLDSEELETLLNAKVDKDTLGDLSELLTDEKEVIVNAINELVNDIEEIRSVSDVGEFIQLLNSKADKSTVGDIANLVDFEDEEIEVTNLVEAINYTYQLLIDSFASLGEINLEGLALSEDLGDKTTLTTDDKTNLVNAINEINAALKTVESVTNVEELSLLLSGKADKSSLGDLSELTTVQKNNIVAAINEINAQIGDVDLSEVFTLLEGKVSQEDFDTAVNVLQSNIDNIELTPGPQGPPGADGQDGEQGLPGQPGADGLSAYQIWLNEGNTGTEQDFLESLEGPQGPPGEGSGGGSSALSTIEDEHSIYNQTTQYGAQVNVSERSSVVANNTWQINVGTESEPQWISGQMLDDYSSSDPNFEQMYVTSDGKIYADTKEIVSGEWDIMRIEKVDMGEMMGLTAYPARNVDVPSYSQVSASYGATTSGKFSQVNASYNSDVSGTYSQINAGLLSDVSGDNSQVNAGRGNIRADRSQINTSFRGDIYSGHGNQMNSSDNSSIGKYTGGRDSTFNQINSSENSTIEGADFAQINASKDVLNDTKYSTAWGYGPYNVNPSTQNIKIHLLSKSGDINHSGVLNSGHNFTDYAELFPNLVGEAQGYGLIQTIDGHGVRPANSGDQVIGVTSATAGVVLGETPFSWTDRWLKDEWGAYIMEDVVDEDWEPNEDQTEEDRPVYRLPKENPDYDPEREYVKRQERPDEWTVVGLVGQVYVRLDENVEPMDYVKPLKDGVGQTSDEPTKLRVMKITQAFDADKGYKIGFCLLS